MTRIESKFCPFNRNDCDFIKCRFGGDDNCRLLTAIESIDETNKERLAYEKTLECLMKW